MSILEIIGDSGSFKSNYTPTVTQLYNRAEEVKITARLNSSDRYIEDILYIYSECTAVIDDRCTAESSKIKRKNDDTAEEIMRRVGDNIGRGRMDGKTMVQIKPRGNAVTTGEYAAGIKSTVNTVENEKSISIDKAVKIINGATYSFLIKTRLEDKGVSVLSPIDVATVDHEYLRFSKYNNCEGIGIPLADIANILHISDEYSPAVHFLLTNGEEWVANLCGGKNNYRRQVESYKEIDADEFLEKLRRCREVHVRHEQEYMSYVATYDMVGGYVSMTSDTPAPGFYWQTACRSKRFKSG